MVGTEARPPQPVRETALHRDMAFKETGNIEPITRYLKLEFLTECPVSSSFTVFVLLLLILKNSGRDRILLNLATVRQR